MSYINILKCPIIFISGPIKIGAIWLTDFLNLLWNPFNELTRVVQIKYPETFAIKAERFEVDFLSRFIYQNSIFTYQLPVNTGDQCLWQGTATAMWALKYNITKDPSDLAQLKTSLVGMNQHQTIHGESTRRLIRGWRLVQDGGPGINNGDQLFLNQGNLVIEDWASNDSLGGHILGIYFAWLYGDADCKQQAIILAKGIADELLNNNNCLIDTNGNPTPFGNMSNGILADPLRLSELLVTYKIAYFLTNDEIYQTAYTKIRLLYGFGGLAKYAKVKLFFWDTDADTQRAAFVLSILADLETNKSIKNGYIRGLKRIQRIMQTTANPWVLYMVARHVALSLDDQNLVKKILSEISIEDKYGDIQKINSTTNLLPITTFQYPPNNWFFISLLKQTSHLRGSQPLPRWKVGAQDFYWQRNLHSVDDWVGNLTPNTFYNGLDYLVVYWLGRNLNLIGETE